MFKPPGKDTILVQNSTKIPGGITKIEPKERKQNPEIPHLNATKICG